MQFTPRRTRGTHPGDRQDARRTVKAHAKFLVGIIVAEAVCGALGEAGDIQGMPSGKRARTQAQAKMGESQPLQLLVESGLPVFTAAAVGRARKRFDQFKIHPGVSGPDCS